MTPNEYLAAELQYFAKEYIKNRVRDIQKIDLENTGDLLRSLYAKVHADPQRGIFFMTVFFREHGRYQDMRRRYYNPGGQEMIDNLKQWAREEGLEKFKQGDYAGKYSKMSNARIENAIAWGIFKKYKRIRTARKRGWFLNKSFKDIDTFYEQLLRGYAEAVAIEAKRMIEIQTQI